MAERNFVLAFCFANFRCPMQQPDLLHVTFYCDVNLRKSALMTCQHNELIFKVIDKTLDIMGISSWDFFLTKAYYVDKLIIDGQVYCGKETKKWCLYYFYVFVLCLLTICSGNYYFLFITCSAYKKRHHSGSPLLVTQVPIKLFQRGKNYYDKIFARWLRYLN